MLNNIDRARAALNVIPSNFTRDEWHKVGRSAIAAGLSIEDIDNWSKPAPNYKGRADVEAAFSTIKQDGGTGAGTLFYIAGQYGYNTHSSSAIVKPSSDPVKLVKQVANANAVAVWERGIAATPAEPYIVRKQGRPDGLRVYPASAEQLVIMNQNVAGYLVVPCWSDGVLQTLQFIPPSKGGKLNMYGSSFGDGFFTVGEITDCVYIVEGIGQGWAANKATGKAAVVTFGSGRMARVAQVLRDKFPTISLIIVPDKGMEDKAAEIAAEISGQWIAMPADKPSNYDVNDYAQEFCIEALSDLLSKTKQPKPEADAFNLDAFVMNGSAREMEEKMLEDKFVLGRLAILGQSTIWYAPPNVGKTLLMLHMLIEAILSEVIDPNDVYFIDADDHHKGLIHKLYLAERYGFKLLAPSYNGFKPDNLSVILAAMVAKDKARGKILILDTAKKFTDIMDKKKGSAFGESVRQFVMHGGTVISLAHTNKHRNEDGGLIYSGTSDLVDDCDCAYTLDAVSNDKVTSTRTVKFSNFKLRGDNALVAVYEYNASEGLSYQMRMDSIKSLTHKETDAAARCKAMEDLLERNLEAVEAIKQCIRNGVTQKTELIKAAMDLSDLPRGKIVTALKDHTGKVWADNQFWHVDVGDNNAHVYVLNDDPIQLIQGVPL